MPKSDRPREKMLSSGLGVLKDEELLAILFGTGTQGLNAIEMGKALITRYRGLHELSRLSVETLQEQKGIGQAKAIHLAAIFELGKRLAREKYDTVKMDSAGAVLGLLGAEMRAEPHEVLKVVLLNTRLTLVGVAELTRGTLNETVAHPRDVLHHVITRRAHAFIVVHNHPSGDPQPSTADRNFTRRLREASEIMQVSFLDHIVIGLPSQNHPGYFSFRESGVL